MVPKRRWNRWRWRRLARAPEAVAGCPVGRPLPRRAELPRSARRALRSRRSRAGGLPRGCTLTLLRDDGVELNQGLLVRVLAEGTSVHPDGERRAAAGAPLLHHGAGGGAQPLLEEWVWLYADNLGDGGDGQVPGWMVNGGEIGDFEQASQPTLCPSLGPERCSGSCRVRGAARSLGSRPQEVGAVGGHIDHAAVLEVDALAAAHVEDAASDTAQQGALGVAQLRVHPGGAATARPHLREEPLPRPLRRTQRCKRGRQAEQARVYDVGGDQRRHGAAWIVRRPTVVAIDGHVDPSTRRRKVVSKAVAGDRPAFCAPPPLGRCPNQKRRRCVLITADSATHFGTSFSRSAQRL
eukprot:scaffold49246_cov60-Phaeocystis_antarctica.AAC.2